MLPNRWYTSQLTPCLAIFYQPQPAVAEKWIKQEYMIWGCVAILLICIMAILATPWGIRATGYEFFRKAHYVLAMLYIGACWGHWQPLKAFMIPGLCIWLVDRGARLIRSFLIHYSYLPDGSMGFQAANAEMSLFRDEENGDVVRLDYTHAHNAWSPGQHFYLCFTQSSIWQSHPFTPLSLPVEKDGVVQHSYIFRAKKGETAKIAKMAAAPTDRGAPLTTPVVMQGPYGEDHTLSLSPDVNVLCVAGGTGITYVLPSLLWLVNQPPNPDRRIALVWSVRRRQDVEWVRKELDILTLAKKHNISITVHVTRELGSEPISPIAAEKSVGVAASSASSSSGVDSVMDVARREHPDLSAVVPTFVGDNVRGRTLVLASGPGGMISDLRRFVSAANSGARVWKGDELANVQLVCDNRLEW
jgi:ferric-chelate reductase